jgi:hypothetical protein
MTMALIGLLARIGIPRYREMKLRATAAAIMGDVHAIRIAAFTHYTEKGAFPPDAGAGTLPPQLVDDLPLGFTFDHTDFDYDWHVWTSTNGSGNTETLVGVSVLVTDPRLAARLVLVAGAGYLPIVTPTQVTFLVANAS